MKRQVKIVIASLILLFIFPIVMSCHGETNSSFKVFRMEDGLAGFSFEYNTRYKVKEPYTEKDFFSVTLIGPTTKEIKDYSSIGVIIAPPDDLIPNAQAAITRVERNASSFPDYKLLGKSEFIIDSIPALRIDYQERNLQPINRGLSYPLIEVHRDVRFDSRGLTWMIYIRSDSSTAETDKVDFEHVLQTFKFLD